MLVRDKHSSLLDLFISYTKMKSCEYTPSLHLRVVSLVVLIYKVRSKIFCCIGSCRIRNLLLKAIIQYTNKKIYSIGLVE